MTTALNPARVPWVTMGDYRNYPDTLHISDRLADELAAERRQSSPEMIAVPIRWHERDQEYDPEQADPDDYDTYYDQDWHDVVLRRTANDSAP